MMWVVSYETQLSGPQAHLNAHPQPSGFPSVIAPPAGDVTQWSPQVRPPAESNDPTINATRLGPRPGELETSRSRCSRCSCGPHQIIPFPHRPRGTGPIRKPPPGYSRSPSPNPSFRGKNKNKWPLKFSRQRNPTAPQVPARETISNLDTRGATCPARSASIARLKQPAASWRREDPPLIFSIKSALGSASLSRNPTLFPLGFVFENLADLRAS